MHVKLFRRHGDRRRRAEKTIASPASHELSIDDVAPLDDEVDRTLDAIDAHVGASHGELDEIEGRLEALQALQESLAEIDLRPGEPQPKRGRVETLDLRTLAEMSEADDDFNSRFDAFAQSGHEDVGARRWIEGR